MNGGWSISYEIALRWMPLDLTDNKSTSVQVMAWCRQATSHYLSQCWPRSISPNGITGPQWVNVVMVYDFHDDITPISLNRRWWYSNMLIPFLQKYVLHILNHIHIWQVSPQLDSSTLDKMAAISQTIFSDAHLWMKSLVSWLKFH